MGLYLKKNLTLKKQNCLNKNSDREKNCNEKQKGLTKNVKLFGVLHFSASFFYNCVLTKKQRKVDVDLPLFFLLVMGKLTLMFFCCFRCKTECRSAFVQSVQNRRLVIKFLIRTCFWATKFRLFSHKTLLRGKGVAVYGNVLSDGFQRFV